jgi:predicted nuclease with TOPRIM domain
METTDYIAENADLRGRVAALESQLMGANQNVKHLQQEKAALLYTLAKFQDHIDDLEARPEKGADEELLELRLKNLTDQLELAEGLKDTYRAMMLGYKELAKSYCMMAGKEWVEE